MVTKLNPTHNLFIGAGGIARLASFPFGPRILFDKENEGGTGGGDDEAAKAAAAAAAAAAKAAADKIAADKAAADKIAADKVAADAAEKARKDAETEEERKKGEKLTEAERKLLREVMDRKEKERTAKAERDAALAELDTFKKKEKEAADKADAEKAEKEKKDAEKSGDFERVKKMMADEAKKDRETLLEQIKTSASALDSANKTINELTVGSAFNSSSFISDETVLTPTVARSAFGAHFESINGVVVAFDKPKGSENRTKLVDASGEPFNFDAAIKRLVEASPDKDKLLKSNMKTGARSTTTNDSTTRVRNSQQRQTAGNSDEPRGLARMQIALSKKPLGKASK